MVKTFWGAWADKIYGRNNFREGRLSETVKLPELINRKGIGASADKGGEIMGYDGEMIILLR